MRFYLLKTDTLKNLILFVTVPYPPRDLAVDTTRDDVIHVGWSFPLNMDTTGYSAHIVCRVLTPVRKPS